MIKYCQKCGAKLPAKRFSNQRYCPNGVCDEWRFNYKRYNHTPKDKNWFGKVNYYDEKISVARANGFDNLVDFVRACYWQWESMSIVGQHLGVTRRSASKMVRKACCEIMPRGGIRKGKRKSNDTIFS